MAAQSGLCLLFFGCWLPKSANLAWHHVDLPAAGVEGVDNGVLTADQPACAKRSCGHLVKGRVKVMER